MRKITVLLLLIIGLNAQAKTFDFTCVEATTPTVNERVESGETYRTAQGCYTADLLKSNDKYVVRHDGVEMEFNTFVAAWVYLVGYLHSPDNIPDNC